MIKKTLGFFGLAILLSLGFFLIVPTAAGASESGEETITTPATAVSPASDTDSQILEEPATEAGSVDHSTAPEEAPPAAVPAHEANAEVQLSMANPFGRTMTMGGRR
ncbi:MAG: hypothetical protein JW797_10275 [Bradymonadales bacterium]|nr:hypothetical protein [Bradymonadales bacterium]